MSFTAHYGTDKLGLARLLEEFANDQWISLHYTEEQAVEAMHFPLQNASLAREFSKRVALAELAFPQPETAAKQTRRVKMQFVERSHCLCNQIA